MNPKRVPTYQLIKSLPPNLNKGAIERAIHTFIKESHANKTADPIGFFNQTLATIYNSFTNHNCEFWAAIGEDGEIYGYSIASFVIDIDARLTYWVNQGWVSKTYRTGEWIRKGWKALERHASTNGCYHIVNVTNRNSRAYLRLLGKDWHHYATILKKDFNLKEK